MQDVLDSIAPVKVLLTDIIGRLQLKGKSFGIYHAASDKDIEDVWNSLHQIDASLKVTDKHPKASLKSHGALKEFMEHCCQQRHYSYCIKKSGDSACGVCKPPRLPPDTFSKIHFVPDPVPQADGHYKSFEDVYGTVTTEEHRPSLAKRSGRSKTLPFVASVQHVRNVNLMVQCEECEMWRLLYSPHKLSSLARQQLSTLLEDFTYTCGATLSDLDLPALLSEVCVREIQCHYPVEKLYFSMNYDPICIHCCCEENLASEEGCYPQCDQCKDRVPIRKKV